MCNIKEEVDVKCIHENWTNKSLIQLDMHGRAGCLRVETLIIGIQCITIHYTLHTTYKSNQQNDIVKK